MLTPSYRVNDEELIPGVEDRRADGREEKSVDELFSDFFENEFEAADHLKAFIRPD